MTVLSISEFLKSPQTKLTSVYGHLVNVFELQNDLSRNTLIYCSFDNALKGLYLSFRYDLDTLEVQDMIYKNHQTQLVVVMGDEEFALLKQTLPIHFDRVGVLVRKITKEMRSDWGRKYKSEVLEHNGYCGYMSRESEYIERHCKTNIISHSLETLSKKRAEAFPAR